MLYLLVRREIKLVSNYRDMSLLSVSFKTLSSILLSRLTPYMYEIVVKIIYVNFDIIKSSRPTN